MVTARNGEAVMLPFRTYEIPGALVSGFLILAACEAGYDGSWLIEQEWNPERISVYGSIALCIGLVVAALSRYLLEIKFVRRWLKSPDDMLLADALASRFSMSLQLCTICRTLCLGLLVVALILVSGILWHSAVSGWGQADWRKLGYCVLSLLEAVGMLFRFLKYYRQHAIETLTSRGDFRSKRDACST
jgi:hypothetical protein